MAYTSGLLKERVVILNRREPYAQAIDALKPKD